MSGPVERCKGCRFFHVSGGYPDSPTDSCIGTCRVKRPPFPDTRGDWWCGEHEPKEQNHEG